MARNTNLLAMALEAPKRERRSTRDDLVESLMQQQKHAGVGTPVHSIGQGVARVANMSLLSLMDKWDKDEKYDEEKSRLKRQADFLLGDYDDTADEGSEAVKLAKVLSGEGITPEGGYVERVVGVESGGDPNAKNPRSSATGPGQFIEQTWLETLGAHRPDLAQGRSREEILALRTDPVISREMTDAYGGQNAQFLQSRGLPVDDGTKYLAHFAGPGGAEKVLTADPATPVRDILGAQVVEANPFLAGWTAADLQDWAGKKMGGGNVAPAGHSAPPAPDGSQVAPGMPQQPYGAPEPSQGQQGGGLLEGLDRRERMYFREAIESGAMTPDQVIEYAQKKRASQQPDYAYEKMDDGTLLQIDKRTGQAKPVYEGGQKPTPSIQEYEYSQQNPEFIDQQVKLKAAGANRSVGTPPPGYRVQYDAQGNPVAMEPIPGGPAALEVEQMERKAADRQAGADRSAAIVTDEIGRATKLAKDGWTTGMSGAILRGLPGTDAHDLVKITDTIKANIGFDRLQQMREASPTGGALGPVSDFENRMLQSVLGSLENSQSKEQLLYNFNRLNDLYLDIIHGPGNRPEEPPEQSGQAGDTAPAEGPPLFGPNGWPVIAETGEEVPPDQVLQQARDAIAEGRSRKVIIEMLQKMGIDPSGL